MLCLIWLYRLKSGARCAPPRATTRDGRSLRTSAHARARRLRPRHKEILDRIATITR